MVYSCHRLWSNTLKNKADLDVLRENSSYSVKEKTTEITNKQQTKNIPKKKLQNNVYSTIILAAQTHHMYLEKL